MEMTYEAIFQEVRKVVNRHDPIQLIAGGAPWDEYDPEVEAILKHYADTNDIDELTEVVWDVFVHYFGEDIVGDKEKYRQLAVDLWQLRR